MNLKFLYFLGSILVFSGLFWLLLPHAFHGLIVAEVDNEAHETSHYIHIIEGLIPTIIGLIFMVNSENKLKSRKANKLNLSPFAKNLQQS